MTMPKPSRADLERVRARWVERLGVITVADDRAIAVMAELLAETRGTLIDLCDLQTRALLAAEINDQDGRCGACHAYVRAQGHRSLSSSSKPCLLNASLSSAGLVTLDDRDAMRAELAKAAAPRWYPQHEECARPGCGHERGRHIDGISKPPTSVEPCDEDGCDCVEFVSSGRMMTRAR